MAKQTRAADDSEEMAPEDLDSIRNFDRGQLEVEWNKQPDLVFKVSKRLAAARAKLRDEELELILVKAETGAAIREDPGAYGCAKPTVDAVKELIPLQKAVHKQMAIVNKAMAEVDVYAGAMEALQNRRSALKYEVELWLAGYFDEPRQPKQAKGALEKIANRDASSRQRKRVTDEED